MTGKKGGPRRKRICPACGGSKAACVFPKRDPQGRCGWCLNRATEPIDTAAVYAAPATGASPPLYVALSKSRVVRLCIVENVVVIAVGTIADRSVREQVTFEGGGRDVAWRVARISQSFLPAQTLTFPLRVLPDVCRALAAFQERAARQRGPRS